MAQAYRKMQSIREYGRQMLPGGPSGADLHGFVVRLFGVIKPASRKRDAWIPHHSQIRALPAKTSFHDSFAQSPGCPSRSDSSRAS
jgi:hypothetical protein